MKGENGREAKEKTWREERKGRDGREGGKARSETKIPSNLRGLDCGAPYEGREGETERSGGS